MISKQISLENADEQIRRLYESAFPDDEQIPWDDLMRLIREMLLDFTAYFDGEVMEQREQSQTCLNSAESRENSTEGQSFIGFTIVYPRKQFNRRTKQEQSGTCSNYALQGGGRSKVNWFWYFAVREELRGKGYGQQILTQLIEKYKGQTCVLYMESPTQVCENIEQRKRRHAFYLRNGFRDTNLYSTYNDITMTIMMIGEGLFTMQDSDDTIHELQ